MKRALLTTSIAISLACVAVAGCSADDSVIPGTGSGGGSTGTAASTTSGSGGNGGSSATTGGQSGSQNTAGDNSSAGGAAGSSTVGAGGTGGGAGNSGAGGSGGGGAGSGGAGGTGGIGGSGGNGGSSTTDGGPVKDGSGSCNPNGKAVSFNANIPGGNDPAKARVEIDFGSSNDLPVGNTTRTIELWAYVLTSSWSGDTNTMFFYGTNNRVADGFGLDFGGVKGSIDPFTNNIFDNDNQPTGLSTSADAWIHFAMTWDGTAVRAFVNGVEKATKMSTVAQKTLMTGKTAFIVGGYPPNFFNGYIDELRIWNIARSATDITGTMNKTLVGNEAGLVGYWKFDETSGTTAADSVTTAGHTAHPGVLMATNTAQLPTFVTGAPLSCP